MITQEEIEEMRNDPEVMAAIRRGVKAMREGRFRSWKDVKAELGITEEPGEIDKCQDDS